MAEYLFRLPDVGEGVAEAEIVSWHVQPGDTVVEDMPLVDVMTDKATVEITSPVEGRVVSVHGAVGEMMPVRGVLIAFEVEGEVEAEQVPAAPPVPPTAPDTDAAAPAPPPPPSPPPPPAAKPAARPPLAAPATRRRARELGIPLEAVPGTGPNGRIRPADLQAYIEGSGVGAGQSGGRRHGVTDVPIIGLRRKIAQRMSEATQRIPHIAYVEECDVTQLEALRAHMNAHRRDGEARLTLLPFLVRALVKVLPDFPHINAHYDDEANVLRQSAPVHVGIATQTPGGLMVPVIRHAEALSVQAIAAEIARLSAAARDGSATREELSGSTITITSLGPLGGIATTPIINHPEVAIVGPNKIVDRVVPDGAFMSVRKMMNLSSSFDHRIVDGHDAARFIQAVKACLEHPALMFI